MCPNLWKQVFGKLILDEVPHMDHSDSSKEDPGAAGDVYCLKVTLI